MSEQIQLSNKSDSIIYLSHVDAELSKLFSKIGDISYTSYYDPYYFLIKTIVSQTLSDKMAAIIFDKVKKACNGNISPINISHLSRQELHDLGLSTSKINYVTNITNAVLNHTIDLNKLQHLSDQEVIDELTSINGIGKWSAKMYLIFVLNRLDVLPVEDKSFIQAYSWLTQTTALSAALIKIKCQKWAPYSSIAAIYLYHAVSIGLTKKISIK